MPRGVVPGPRMTERRWRRVASVASPPCGDFRTPIRAGRAMFSGKKRKFAVASAVAQGSAVTGGVGGRGRGLGRGRIWHSGSCGTRLASSPAGVTAERGCAAAPTGIASGRRQTGDGENCTCDCVWRKVPHARRSDWSRRAGALCSPARKAISGGAVADGAARTSAASSPAGTS